MVEYGGGLGCVGGWLGVVSGECVWGDVGGYCVFSDGCG